MYDQKEAYMDKQRAMQNQAGMLCEAKRATAADELTREVEQLANRIEVINQRLQGKLAMYLGSYPNEAMKENCTPVRQLPPYFDNLRDYINRCNFALEDISRTIDACEL